MTKLGGTGKRVICIARDRGYVVATIRKGLVKFTGRSRNSCVNAVGKLFLAHGDKFGLLFDVVEQAGCSTATIRGRGLSNKGDSRYEAVGRILKEHPDELGFTLVYDNGSFKECG